jgi:hypothetical protein
LKKGDRGGFIQKISPNPFYALGYFVKEGVDEGKAVMVVTPERRKDKNNKQKMHHEIAILQKL